MYPNYNMYNNRTNMYKNNKNDRFIGGGIVAPLLIGGIAGYAIGKPNNNCCNNNYYPYPYPYYPYNNYYPQYPQYYSNNYYY